MLKESLESNVHLNWWNPRPVLGVETSWLTSQFFLDWGQFGRNMKIGQLNRSINTLYIFIWYTVIRYQLFDMLTSKSNPGNGWFISKQNNIYRYINISNLNISRSNFWDLDVCQEYQEFKRAWKQAMRKQEIERIKVVKTRAGGHGVTWFVTAKLQRPEQGEWYVYQWVCP